MSNSPISPPIPASTSPPPPLLPSPPLLMTSFVAPGAKNFIKEKKVIICVISIQEDISTLEKLRKESWLGGVVVFI